MTDTCDTPVTDTPPPTAPSFIRCYAATGVSEASRLALGYVKSLLRIAPVRVIPADGAGIWPGYESLLSTKAAGSYINVVACGPDAWCRTHRIPMPRKPDPFVGHPLSSSWTLDQTSRPSSVEKIEPPPPEVMIERVDYWTAKVRNVLFAAAPPRDQWQLEAARKFDVIVVPSNHAKYHWGRQMSDLTRVVMIEPPASDYGHAAIRAALIPPAHPKVFP